MRGLGHRVQRRSFFSGPGIREWYLGERCWRQTSYEASFIVPRRPPRSMATALAIPGHLLAAQDESLGYPAADYLDRQTEYTS